jgi:pimeloyl-ACP methyl ester carboxylesterase
MNADADLARFKSAEARQRYLDRYDLRAAAWPVPSETRMVDTSFGQTFVRRSGPASAPAVMLLPGIGSPGLTFSANVAALSERRATYAIDNIHDNGRSIETKPIKDAADYATWLDEVREGLGLARVDLVGLSYGGWIATRYALAHPDRVGKLVLWAPAGTVAPIPWGFIWRAILCLIPARWFMRNFMNWVRTDFENPMLDQMEDDGWLAQRCFKARKMVAPLPLGDDEWKALAVPTLFLVGDREVIFAPEEALAKLARVAPAVETALLPGVGHDAFVVRAEEMNRRTVEFLERG